MLNERKIVLVPAQVEIDADIAEYGSIGFKCRASYGEAAIDAGSPDMGKHPEQTDLVDMLANVLHFINYYPEANLDFDEAINSAWMHFRAELEEDSCR